MQVLPKTSQRQSCSRSQSQNLAKIAEQGLERQAQIIACRHELIYLINHRDKFSTLTDYTNVAAKVTFELISHQLAIMPLELGTYLQSGFYDVLIESIQQYVSVEHTEALLIVKLLNKLTPHWFTEIDRCSQELLNEASAAVDAQDKTLYKIRRNHPDFHMLSQLHAELNYKQLEIFSAQLNKQSKIVRGDSEGFCFSWVTETLPRLLSVVTNNSPVFMTLMLPELQLQINTQILGILQTVPINQNQLYVEDFKHIHAAFLKIIGTQSRLNAQVEKEIYFRLSCVFLGEDCNVTESYDLAKVLGCCEITASICRQHKLTFPSLFTVNYATTVTSYILRNDCSGFINDISVHITLAYESLKSELEAMVTEPSSDSSQLVERIRCECEFVIVMADRCKNDRYVTLMFMMFTQGALELALSHHTETSLIKQDNHHDRMRLGIALVELFFKHGELRRDRAKLRLHIDAIKCVQRENETVHLVETAWITECSYKLNKLLAEALSGKISETTDSKTLKECMDAVNIVLALSEQHGCTEDISYMNHVLAKNAYFQLKKDSKQLTLACRDQALHVLSLLQQDLTDINLNYEIMDVKRMLSMQLMNSSFATKGTQGYADLSKAIVSLFDICHQPPPRGANKHSLGEISNEVKFMLWVSAVFSVHRASGEPSMSTMKKVQSILHKRLSLDLVDSRRALPNVIDRKWNLHNAMALRVAAASKVGEQVKSSQPVCLVSSAEKLTELDDVTKYQAICEEIERQQWPSAYVDRMLEIVKVARASRLLWQSTHAALKMTLSPVKLIESAIELVKEIAVHTPSDKLSSYFSHYRSRVTELKQDIVAHAVVLWRVEFENIEADEVTKEKLLSLEKKVQHVFSNTDAEQSQTSTDLMLLCGEINYRLGLLELPITNSITVELWACIRQQIILIDRFERAHKYGCKMALPYLTNAYCKAAQLRLAEFKNTVNDGIRTADFEEAIRHCTRAILHGKQEAKQIKSQLEALNESTPSNLV